MKATLSPGAMARDTPARMALPPPATTVTPSMLTRPSGAGNAIGSSTAAPEALSSAEIRRHAMRHCCRPRHAAIDWSSGASARDSRIELAIIPPGVMWPWRERYAPSARVAIWATTRRNLPAPIITVPRSAAAPRVRVAAAFTWLA